MEIIEVKQNFNLDSRVVWEAITQHEKMIKWYFENIPEFKPKIGFSTKFIVTNEGRTFTHCWKITNVIENRLIEYNWKYDEYKGDSNVKFELTESNNVTELVVTHSVIEPFNQSIPEFKPESCLGGWQYFINERLKNYLDK